MIYFQDLLLLSTTICSMHVCFAYLYILHLLFVLNQENRLVVIPCSQHSQKMKRKHYFNTPCVSQIGKKALFSWHLSQIDFFFYFLKNVYKVQCTAQLPFVRDQVLSTKTQQATHWAIAFLYLFRIANKTVFSKLSAAVQILVFRSFVVAVTVMTQLTQAQKHSFPFELGKSLC